MMLTDKQLGKYHLMHSIGGGGMGEIYLAEDSRIPRQVAIKVIRAEAEIYPNAEEAQEARRLFQREMRAVTMLNHPYILPLFDFGEECVEGHTVMYLVMPWQAEGSLADWLQRREDMGKRLNLQEAAHFVSEAADALQHVHEHALIHQDVKPSNFLMRGRSETMPPDVLLSDFGISKIAAATSSSLNIRGTPTYMAPEQWQGHPVPATDQYALAVMAYLLLTGHFPFTGQMEHLLHQHFFVEPQPPSIYNPSIPPDIDAAILTALAKKPEERFSSMLVFSQVFQEQEHHSSSHAQPWFFPGCALSARPTGFSTEIAPSSIDHPLADAPEKEAPGVESSPSQYSTENAPVARPDSANLPTRMHTSLGVSRIDWLQARATSISAMKGNVGKTLLVILLLLALTIANLIGLGRPQQGQPSRSVDTALAAYPHYMPGTGPGVFQDPLQEPNYWKTTNNYGGGGSCWFANGALHVTETTKNSFYLCNNELTLANKTAFEVKMRIVKGNCGDVYFHYDSKKAGGTNHGYLFSICVEKNEGDYAITKHKQFDDPDPASLTTTAASPAIKTSPGGTNTLGIYANGGAMTFYINGKQIAHIIDTSYSGGSIGLCADTAGEQEGQQSEVAFTDARVWEVQG